MLTLKECRKLVDPKGDKYTDEELKLMLDFLTEIASITVTNLKNKQDEKARSYHVPSVQ